MKMVKNGIRKILIAFIIVVVSFQSSFVGKAAEEPTIIDVYKRQMWDYSWTGVRLSSAPLNDKNDFLEVVFI